MMMHRISLAVTPLALLGLLILSAGCSPTFGLKLSSDEKAYLTRTRQVPLTLTIPAEKADDAWARAEGFVATYSDLPLVAATDFLIETSVGTDQDPNVSYKITRFNLGDQVEVRIECAVKNMFSQRDVDHNAHILADYILTGELPFPRLVR